MAEYVKLELQRSAEAELPEADEGELVVALNLGVVLATLRLRRFAFASLRRVVAYNSQLASGRDSVFL
jgi:hypothetical protein